MRASSQVIQPILSLCFKGGILSSLLGRGFRLESKRMGSKRGEQIRGGEMKSKKQPAVRAGCFMQRRGPTWYEIDKGGGKQIWRPTCQQWHDSL